VAVVTMRQLLESGAHFGHQTKRWNPKMKRFIFTERNGIYIIDLTQSLGYIDRAYDFVKETVAHGGTIMFVGTKRQAQESISEQAARVGMPYVTERWLGGMLTNFATVHKRLQRLKELELIEQTGGQTVLTKKEALVLDRERRKLERTLGGIREMTRTPSAVWIVDTNKEHLAVDEARKLGIPVVAILDTNCDPDVVDYKIPGNDDAIRSIQVLTRVIADAVAEGLMARAGAGGDGGTPSVDGQVAGDEPLPEWETEVLVGVLADTSPSAPPGKTSGLAGDALASGAAAQAAGVADGATIDSAGWAEPVAGAADAQALEPTAPDPTAPDPTAPDPTAPDPTAPDPTAPDPTAPDPTAPDPTASDPTASDPTASDPTASDPTAPEPTVPDPTVPDPTVPDPTVPDPTVPDPTVPDPTVRTPS